MGDAENTGDSPSGTLGRKHATLTPKSSEIDLVHSVKRGGVPTKKESRLVNWLKRGDKSKSFDFDREDTTSVTSISGLSDPHKRTMRQATIVQRAKRRVEERLKKIKLGRDPSKEEHGGVLGGGVRGASNSRIGSMENISNENVTPELTHLITGLIKI